MEQNQQSTKRTFEQRSEIAPDSQCQIQYVNYVPVAESAPQIIQYVYAEKPMCLNTWTQTPKFTNEEQIKRNLIPTHEQQKEIERLTLKMEKYKRMVEMMNEQPKVPILCPLVKNPTTPHTTTSRQRILCKSPINIQHEGRVYRISTQSESNNEGTIGVELNKEETEEMMALNLNNRTSPPASGKRKGKVSSPPRNSSPSPAPESESPNREIKRGAMISIGPNETQIRAEDFAKIDWKTSSTATRKLLTLVFDRKTLATHSMTGKPSPAFKYDKPVKEQLNQEAIQDIIYIVSRKCAVREKEVRTAITTKCADENKMYKSKVLKDEKRKKTPLKEVN